MRKHVISFVKAPVGYLCNLAASLCGWLPHSVGEVIASRIPCEMFCINDGVQDDVHPWGR